MMKRTIFEYDIYHTGDDMVRHEILHMLETFSAIARNSKLADVEVSSEKTDLICVKIHTFETL